MEYKYYLFENCGALLAAFNPYFFLSLLLESLVTNPLALRTLRYESSFPSFSLSYSNRALVIPNLIAPVCPEKPPPDTLTSTSNVSKLLVISNGCYMEDKIDFQEMKNLTFLYICENSCKNVSRVVLENSQLTRIEIGKNSFTTSGPTEKLFTILNCPKLTNLRIHSNSFREFSLFSIKCIYCNR